MKKRIILCLSFLLVGCNNSNIQQSIISNDQSFTNDLASLFDFNDENVIYNENFPFNLKCYQTNSSEKNGYYVVTVEISYKEIKIDHVKIITIPSSIKLENKPKAISNVGYDNNNYILDNYVDVNNFIFKGFRISYLTDKKEDGIKISFKGQTENKKINQLFYVSNSDFQNESDIS